VFLHKSNVDLNKTEYHLGILPIFHSAASSLVSRSTTTLVVLVALVLQQDHHVAENVHEVDEQHDLTRRGTIEGSFTTVCYYASVRPVVNGGLMGAMLSCIDSNYFPLSGENYRMVSPQLISS
jgi:hypothetical protein